ncbi:MAG: archaeosortase/exosortase family protein [Candidatus Methanofastidiosia archaeon]
MNIYLLLILAVMWGICVAGLYKKRQWLIYYIVAVFGLTLLLVLLTMHIGYDTKLAEIEVSHTSFLLNMLGINAGAKSTQLFIPTPEGWSVLVCGIECSALLELSVLFSLILFYLRFSAARKMGSLILGVGVTYIANMFRLSIIAGIAHYYGEEYIFLAHAVIGRLLFFGFVLFIYWYIVTKPTIRIIGKSIVEDALSKRKGGG